MVTRLSLAFLLFSFPVAADLPNITDLCQQLVEYQPSADVDYKEGVDVNGENVVPADLNGGTQIEIPEATDVIITVDQAQLLGLPNNVPYKPTAIIGAATVHKNGDVYYNGKRISQSQIQVLCQDSAEAGH